MDENYYSPEQIALLLALDQFDNAKTGIDTFTPEKDTGNPYSYIFEILMTIFMELLFVIAKADHDGNNDNKNKKFTPKYDNLKIDALTSIVTDKMIWLGYIAHVKSYEKEDLVDDKEQFDNLCNKNRYCLVLLKDYHNHAVFKTKQAESRYYHMVLNKNIYKKKFKKLNDIYAIIDLNDKLYKISFVKA
jgi:hypothetical protein